MSLKSKIEVYADWLGLGGPARMGELFVNPSRGKEIFSFEYDEDWLESDGRQQLDPTMSLYRGRQYPSRGKENFGAFLDSSPDRWGRVIMRRREAQQAREEGREERRLFESDYLLGVHDAHRMGGLRFCVEGRFLDDRKELASPPWTSLRELEQASLRLEDDHAEDDPSYSRWLRMLIAPGGSLGGARPKASVVDEMGHLWIAKFPSRRDDEDIGAWESVLHTLAQRAGLTVPQMEVRRFGASDHTFLSRRFDRVEGGQRLHCASAMTLLERKDGDSADEGASYMELVDFLLRLGARPSRDLEQLWRRIVFFMCVSNTDDHLRNHSFMLEPSGWALTPAYDMNPDRFGEGLKLNVSESDNAQDLNLAMQVAGYFRLTPERARVCMLEVVQAAQTWSEVAESQGISKSSQGRMQRAFRVANTRQLG